MKTITLLFGLLFISSCHVVQIMITDQTTNNMRIDHNNYVFENDTIKITYGFWSKDGIMAFLMENKLDIPIYVDWKKSAFISDNTKKNYYTEKEVSTIRGRSDTYSGYYFNWSRWIPGSRSNYNEASVVQKEERIVFIPPHATTSRATYRIYPAKYVDMDKMESNYNENGVKGKFIDYNRNNSIIVFRNFITYSTKETFDTERYINNEFYVSRVIETIKPNLDKFEDYKRFYVFIETPWEEDRDKP